MTDAVLIVSGGLDSVTLAYHFAAASSRLHLLSFDYGQRHRKELGHAEATAKDIGADWDLIDLSALGRALPSALTDTTTDVPEGHYAAESMKATVVPNRNAIMLSIAAGIAVAENAALVATAVHAGDHYVYPDCRPEFITALDLAIRTGNEGFGHPDLHLAAPFLHMTKAEIVGLGAAAGVPFERTWSCYVGGDVHCGRCGTCVERREAFDEAGVPDPTTYA